MLSFINPCQGIVESKGKYTTKEEVEKAPSDDHPCNLTRTSFKVQNKCSSVNK